MRTLRQFSPLSRVLLAISLGLGTACHRWVLKNTGVPLDGVESLDVQQANSLATGALLVGIAAVVGFALVAITYIVAVNDPLY